MRIITKVLDAIYMVIRYAIAVILGVAILLTFTEVIRRYIFGKSFIWSEELMRYLFVYVGFVGGAAAFREKSLSCFDLISKKIKSQRAKAILDLVINTAIIGLVMFLGIKGVRVAGLPSIAKQHSVGLGLSMKYVYMAIPIGCFLMAVFGLENYMEIIPRVIGKKTAVEDGGNS